MDFHKDYNGNKNSECKCTECLQEFGKDWCWMNCEYMERQKQCKDLDFFMFHTTKTQKTFEIDWNRLMFYGEFSCPDFLCYFVKENRYHYNWTQFERRKLTEWNGLLDFLEAWGIVIDIEKKDSIIQLLEKHWYTYIY